MMEVKVAELSVRVENLEDWREKHEREDAQNHKYANHMLENQLERLAGIERSTSRFEADLAHRNGHQLTTQESLKEIYDRIRHLERLVWVAVGGVAVVSGLVSITGVYILKIFAR